LQAHATAVKYKKAVEQAQWRLLHERRKGLRCFTKICKDCVVSRRSAGISMFRQDLQGLRITALEIGQRNTQEGKEGNKCKAWTMLLPPEWVDKKEQELFFSVCYPVSTGYYSIYFGLF
jgi:hypothetical protein